MSFNIKGNSGCDVFLKDGNVIKKATDKKYSDRLYLQYEKQKNFSDSVVSTPSVLNHGNESDLFWFEMEYIRFKSFDDYFLLCGLSELNNIADSILSFIDRNIVDVNSFDSSKLISKYEDVKDNIFRRHKIDVNYLNTFFYDIDPIVELPVGYSHGDLTFSNMLIDNNSIVLIDFLDSFIETPLNDIVKLRQDTRYFWSLSRIKKIHDLVKVKQNLVYIDNKIVEHFEGFSFYQKYYNYFQGLNLLRIIPYCRNRSDVDRLLGDINLLCIH
jgi:serine/threonine protein kinase